MIFFIYVTEIKNIVWQKGDKKIKYGINFYKNPCYWTNICSIGKEIR